MLLLRGQAGYLLSVPSNKVNLEVASSLCCVPGLSHLCLPEWLSLTVPCSTYLSYGTGPTVAPGGIPAPSVPLICLPETAATLPMPSVEVGWAEK